MQDNLIMLCQLGIITDEELATSRPPDRSHCRRRQWLRNALLNGGVGDGNRK